MPQVRRIEDEEDRKELKRLKAEAWMGTLLEMNPAYTSWGPYEDYMSGTGGQWTEPAFLADWPAFVATWELNELNEVVNFYFYVEREAKDCQACEASGLNPKSKEISDGFYAHSSPTGRGWNDAITQDELDALIAEGRIPKGAKLADVNASQPGGVMRIGYSHDAINRWILIEARAKRLGVWGKCAECKGDGYLFTSPRARLGLVLWVLHPRKGCSRGVEIKDVPRDHVHNAVAFLQSAAKRNADRFAKLGRVP